MTETENARDAGHTIFRMIVVLCLVIVVLCLMLFYAIARETDAVSALKHNSDRTECRSDISTDTYQRYWVDIAKALDASERRDNVTLNAVTRDMLAIPLIKRQVAQSCPPALSANGG